MITSMAATHAANKKLSDANFEAAAACKEAAAKVGADKVTDSTLGAIMDESGKLACIPTMEKVYRALPMADAIAYAPVSGLPGYLDTVIALTFADMRPDGYTAACATPGGTGAIHLSITNYSEIGDGVLTADWFWGPYSALCQEEGRHLVTFSLFDDAQDFNIADFTAKVDGLLEKQQSLLVILNTPAHNPTGYSLSESDWSAVLEVAKKHAAAGKKLTILCDIAYIDYAGEKNEARAFMKQFANLPENILVLFAFSMSKGYTMYGQRCGALVALTQSKAVIDEFQNVTKFSSRAAWSNCNRGAMSVLTTIQQDEALLAQFEQERAALYEIIKQRGAIFMDEAKACGLNALPYKAGFFISIPSADPKAVCDKLHDDLIFCVPMKKGVRVAVCAVPTAKMRGMAAKIKDAMKAVGQG